MGFFGDVAEGDTGRDCGALGAFGGVAGDVLGGGGGGAVRAGAGLRGCVLTGVRGALPTMRAALTVELRIAVDAVVFVGGSSGNIAFMSGANTSTDKSNVRASLPCIEPMPTT